MAYPPLDEHWQVCTNPLLTLLNVPLLRRQADIAPALKHLTDTAKSVNAFRQSVRLADEPASRTQLQRLKQVTTALLAALAQSVTPRDPAGLWKDVGARLGECVTDGARLGAGAAFVARIEEYLAAAQPEADASTVAQEPGAESSAEARPGKKHKV